MFEFPPLVAMPTIPPLLGWTPCAAPVAPPAGELHLWCINADRDWDWDRLESDCRILLSNAEWERGQRLRDPRLQHRFLLTHLATRQILGAYLGCPPHRIGFAHIPTGKPRVSEPTTDLEFNLCTTGALALLALRRGEPLGIDCELLREPGDPIAIARRMFTHQQAQRIERLEGESRRLAFFTAWTALEARVKRDGRGLAGYRQPDHPDIAVLHARPNPDAICALAGRCLPDQREWLTLDWQG